MKKKWDLYNISVARNVLFGFATLLIMFFHSSIRIPETLPVLQFFHKTGNVGVDIFLFLSAIGLYFSFSKNKSISEFYQRRMIRILPALFLFNVIWFAFTGSHGLDEYFSNVLMISFFTQGERAVWFMALLVVLYLAYPLLYHALKRWHGTAAILLLSIIVIGNYVVYRFFPDVYQHIEIATTRIPVFICGAWMADKVKNHKQISYLWLLGSGLTAVFLLVLIYYFPNPWGYYTIIRYSYCLLAIALVILLSALFARFSVPFISAFLIWIGGYSLEIYLLHEELLVKFGRYVTSKDPYNLIQNLVFAVIAVLGAMLLQSICTRLVRELRQ